MADATVKKVRDKNNMCWEYLEKGCPNGKISSVLFLHGFNGKKENWTSVIKNLPSNLHIIAVDLPGHGNTDKIALEDHIYPLLVRKIHQFVEAVGLDLKPFHIVGYSLGGAITLCYSATHAMHIAGASIICPAIGTPAIALIEEEKNLGKPTRFKGTSAEELQKIADKSEKMKRTMLSGPSYQDFFAPLYSRLGREESRHAAVNAAEHITSPSQIMWGAEDMVGVLNSSAPGKLQSKGILETIKVHFKSRSHPMELDAEYARELNRSAIG